MLIKPLHIGTIRGQQQLDDAASRMKRANIQFNSSVCRKT
jgi:hypothetical protein